MTRIYEADQVGHLVRTRRHERKWSAARLAKEAGISAAMVTLIETGRRTGSLEVLLRILEALDMKMTIQAGGDVY